MAGDLLAFLGADLYARLLAHLRTTVEREDESDKQFEHVIAFILEMDISSGRVLVNAFQGMVLSASQRFAQARTESAAGDLMREAWDQALPDNMQNFKTDLVEYLSRHFSKSLAEDVVARLLRARVN